jgi:proline iminopeptidase
VDEKLPFMLFIHGGPGFNSEILETIIEQYHLFDSLKGNLIFYDQRNCGRSANNQLPVSHNDNINDLQEIYSFLQSKNIEVSAFIGNSYGSKLLYDFYKQYPKIRVPGIFIAMAESILIPRVNNLMLDLNYLKMEKPEEYKKILSEMKDANFNSLWPLTEKLAPLFKENKMRPYFYWANIEWFEKYQKIKEASQYKDNLEVFTSVRKDLYQSVASLDMEVNTLDIDYVWINGFHDYIMAGASGLLQEPKKSRQMKLTFMQSAHYPHIEENERFCEVVNDFLKNTHFN